MLRPIATFIICLFVGLTPLFANTIEVKFDADTVHACLNEPFDIQPQVSGGTAPYTYLWSNGSSDSILSTIPTQSLTSLTVVVTDALNDSDTAELIIHALTECVYPGDANGDGAANNLDLLNLGLAYGQSGYLRPNAHLNWVGQPSHSWNQSFQNGVNFAHVDGDGNGVLNEDDILAISHNYLVPNSMASATSNSGVPLFVEFDANNVQPGDTVHAKVMIGNSSLPADSLYGIAFSLELGGYEIDSGSIQVLYDQSVLGRPSEILSIDKAFYDRTRIEVGITRFDGVDVAVAGQLAEIIVVIDEIIGKRQGIDILDFNLKNVSINSGSGKVIQSNPSNSAITIITGAEKTFNPIDLKLSTLQGKGWLLDLGENQGKVSSVKVYATGGQLLYRHTFSGNKHFIPAERLADGMYILFLEGQNSNLYRKIIKN